MYKEPNFHTLFYSVTLFNLQQSLDIKIHKTQQLDAQRISHHIGTY